MLERRLMRIIPLIPYLAVAFGMYGVCSAWAALGLYHAGMLTVLALGAGEKAEREKRRIRLGWLPLIAIVFAMGGVAFYFLWPCLGRDGRMVAERLAVFGVSKHAWPYFAAYFCIVNAILEELFWRGYLGSDKSGVMPNDLFFAGYHVFVLLAFMNPIWAVPVFIACAFSGWLWRRLRVASGGLLLPVLTHIIADLGIVVAVHLRAFS